MPPISWPDLGYRGEGHVSSDDEGARRLTKEDIKQWAEHIGDLNARRRRRRRARARPPSPPVYPVFAPNAPKLAPDSTLSSWTAVLGLM